MAGYPYRVFISYAHDDKPLAQRVAAALESVGLAPIADWDTLPGSRFSDKIQTGIARAHVFMPIITPDSVSRPWVQQEIGFAKASNVPVVPLACGENIGQMIAELQALVVDCGAECEQTTDGQLVSAFGPGGRVRWTELVEDAEKAEFAVFQRVDSPHGRAELLATAAARAPLSHVRQQASLTSFCLPETKNDQNWTELRDLERLLFLVPEERIELEKHARAEGCSLIIDPDSNSADLEPDVQRARVKTLIEFLDGMEDARARVVTRRLTSPENLLVIGDWFAAQSLSVQAKLGYRQVIATWHAPTVLRYARGFDKAFELLDRQERERRGKRSSRVYAIDRLWDAYCRLKPK